MRRPMCSLSRATAYRRGAIVVECAPSLPHDTAATALSPGTSLRARPRRVMKILHAATGLLLPSDGLRRLDPRPCINPLLKLTGRHGAAQVIALRLVTAQVLQKPPGPRVLHPLSHHGKA